MSPVASTFISKDEDYLILANKYINNGAKITINKNKLLNYEKLFSKLFGKNIKFSQNVMLYLSIPKINYKYLEFNTITGNSSDIYTNTVEFLENAKENNIQFPKNCAVIQNVDEFQRVVDLTTGKMYDWLYPDSGGNIEPLNNDIGKFIFNQIADAEDMTEDELIFKMQSASLESVSKSLESSSSKKPSAKDVYEKAEEIKKKKKELKDERKKDKPSKKKINKTKKEIEKLNSEKRKMKKSRGKEDLFYLNDERVGYGLGKSMEDWVLGLEHNINDEYAMSEEGIVLSKNEYESSKSEIMDEAKKLYPMMKEAFKKAFDAAISDKIIEKINERLEKIAGKHGNTNAKRLDRASLYEIFLSKCHFKKESDLVKIIQQYEGSSNSKNKLKNKLFKNKYLIGSVPGTKDLIDYAASKGANKDAIKEIEKNGENSKSFTETMDTVMPMNAAINQDPILAAVYGTIILFRLMLNSRTIERKFIKFIKKNKLKYFGFKWDIGNGTQRDASKLFIVMKYKISMESLDSFKNYRGTESALTKAGAAGLATYAVVKKIQWERNKKLGSQLKFDDDEKDKKKKGRHINGYEAFDIFKNPDLKSYVEENKSDFGRYVNQDFTPKSIGAKISRYMYNKNYENLQLNLYKFKESQFKEKVFKELESFDNMMNKIIDKSIKDCFSRESISAINENSIDGFSYESLKDLLNNNIERFDMESLKELFNNKINSLEIPLYTINKFSSLVKKIATESRLLTDSIEMLEKDVKGKFEINNVCLALESRFIEEANNKSKFFNIYKMSYEDRDVIYLAPRFDLVLERNPTRSFVSTRYLPNKMDYMSEEDAVNIFLNNNLDERTPVEIDLARPYMALSAIYGLSLRNPNEKRLVYQTKKPLNGGLFDLACIPNKVEEQVIFEFSYSQPVSFDFIEKIKTNIDNLSQSDILHLCYEFGRTLAYYTFLLTLNRSKLGEVANVVDEVKVILIALWGLVKSVQEKGGIIGLVGNGSSIDREYEVDKLENGDWGIDLSISESFDEYLDGLDRYTDGTYNDIPFPIIFNLAYTALNYVLLGVVSTKLDKKSVTLNRFLMNCKSGIIPELVDNLLANENSNESAYNNKALLGMIYAYYKLRSFYNEVYPFINANSSNKDIFFNTIYRIGEFLETKKMDSSDNANNFYTYYDEILNNKLFKSEMRLIDLLDVDKVLYASETIVKEGGINIPILIASELQDILPKTGSISTNHYQSYQNPIWKILTNASAKGGVDSFDIKSMELYILEYLSNVECNIVSPYRIYKLVMIASMARYILKSIQKAIIRDEDYINSIYNVLIISESLIMKLYHEWFRSNSSAYRYEERYTDYPVKTWYTEKGKYLRREIGMILQLYVAHVFRIEELLDVPHNDYTLKEIYNNKFKDESWNKLNIIFPKGTVVPDSWKNFDNYNAFKGNKFTPIGTLLGDRNTLELQFGFKNVIIECLNQLQSLHGEKEKINALIQDLIPLPQTSSKSEAVDAIYKDTSYPSEAFRRIINNISGIIKNGSLLPATKFYLTYCLTYSAIIRNQMNSMLIQPESNIVKVTDGDDIMELGTQTSNSIESYMVKVFNIKKPQIHKKKRIF